MLTINEALYIILINPIDLLTIADDRLPKLNNEYLSRATEGLGPMTSGNPLNKGRCQFLQNGFHSER